MLSYPAPGFVVTAAVTACLLLQLQLPARADTHTKDTTPDSGRSISQISFCGDLAGWPPYTFEHNGRVTGVDADFLQQALSLKGIRYSILMLPWKRCLQNVELGSLDVALSASASAPRQKTFRVTEVYYSLTPSYIALKSRFPEGLTLPPDQVAQRYRVCGLRGYDYSQFGFRPEQVERTSSSLKQLFQKTYAQRCDLLIARQEIVQGFALTGTPLMDPQWQSWPIPGAERDHFSMLVSRNIADSEAVHQLLNKLIRDARGHNLIQQLQQRYLSSP